MSTELNDCDHRGGAGVPTITRDTAPASGASLGSHVGGSMLTDDDKTEIDARITERISMFRETLIEQGQIQDVSLRGPSAIRPPSDCIQSARTHWGGQQEDPIPRSAVVAIKDWEVYSTATSDRSLLVRSRSTGMRGYVADPTPQEWSDAFHAPSNPYPWRHPERVIADPTTAAPFSEEVKQEAIERAYGVCEN